MATTLSPNMSLVIPGVGTESGPNYALDVNQSLSVVDQHDHSAGNGVAISPGGININSALTFNSNFATNLGGLTLIAQGSTPANNTIYESGVDLYFVDGSGNNVRITSGGAVAGSPGSISGLASPASASYVSGSSTFVWQSAATPLAANMDFGSAILRNLSPNSTFGLTLQPPAALGSNYAITLPTLPASQKIMTLDASGAMAAPYTVDGTTIAISSNVIGIPAQSIGPTQVSTSFVTSGTYSPSFTPLAGISIGSVGTTLHQYMRVGNVVTVSGQTNFTITSSVFSLSLTLPITSNNFTAENQAGGGGQSNINVLAPVGIFANVGSGRVIILGGASISGNTAISVFYSFTYLVV